MPERNSNDTDDASSSSSTAMVTLSPQQLQQLIQGAISGALAASHTTPPSGISSPNHVDRPTIDLECNESRWAFFLNEWKLYKRRTKLPEAAAAEELRACCSEELRMELFHFAGPSTIDSLSEEQLLSNIKELAVKGKNTAVHRQDFYSIQQTPGQPIQQYVATLKAKSEQCDFRVKCNNACCDNTFVSYASAMIADQMVVGLYDKQIQGEILAKHSTLGTFQAKYDLIQALEEGKRAREQLSAESSLSAQRSTYKKQKPAQTSSNEASVTVCPGCGSTSHGPGTDKPRSKQCPARNHKCQYCSIIGHFQTVCRKRLRADTTNTNSMNTNTPPSSTSNVAGQSTCNTTGDDFSWLLTSMENKKNATFLSTLRTENHHAWKARTSHSKTQSPIPDRIIVPHMEWSQLNKRFEPQRPSQLPKLRIKLSIIREAHQHFKRPIAMSKCIKVQNGSIDAYADSGAQTCACGIDTIHYLGIEERDLIPTSHRILGVTSTAMDLVGVFLAKLSSGDSDTRQVIYVSRNTKGFFLSERALRDLGSLSASFPIPDSTITSTVMKSGSTNPALAPCGCPRRTKPPPRPDSLPFDPVDKNVQKLEKWIQSYFQSSAFNVCEHQPLPCMTGNALEIHFKPDVKPVAFHCPIPVPHHWEVEG